MAQSSSLTGDPIWVNTTWTTSIGPQICISGVVNSFPNFISFPNNSSSGVPATWQQPWQQPNIVLTPSITISPSTWGSIPAIFDKDAFVTFIRAHLTNKCLVFENLCEKTIRIVDKYQALKFVWVRFGDGIVAPTFSDYKAIEFKDEEWHVYFKTAETSDELVEAFDFTYDDICQKLSI